MSKLMKESRYDFSSGTRRKILKKSGYICNNPACRRLLWDRPNNCFYGKVAHIIAASSKGPRAIQKDFDQAKDQITSEDNGIILCLTCESMVDSDPTTYPVDFLQKWKSDWESFFKEYLEEEMAKSFIDQAKDINHNYTKLQKTHHTTHQKTLANHSQARRAYQKNMTQAKEYISQLETQVQELEAQLAELTAQTKIQNLYITNTAQTFAEKLGKIFFR